VQRRHQKLVEESPSPLLDDALRARMGELALSLVRRVGYVNAGTLEFLVDAERRPYFLEMNTRLQVEHPVTELVTGIDLVRQQIRIAAGEPLGLEQHQLVQRGHAIECRVYAEDPDTGFLPSPGRIEALRVPGGPGVRDDSGVCQGSLIPVHYDPLVSKLAAWAETRAEAIARLLRAVREYRVVGVRTTLPFFDRLLRSPEFVAGDYDTGLVARLLAEPDSRERDVPLALLAAGIAAFEDRRLERAPTAPGAASAWLAAARREATGARTGSRE
jgi:acetyl-CoA carboxylase biotin carboxylase subunit